MRSPVFTAKALRKASETELLIEEIHPSWLPKIRQRLFYGLISGLILGLLFGLVFALSKPIFEAMGKPFGGSMDIPPGELIFGLLVGLFIELSELILPPYAIKSEQVTQTFIHKIQLFGGFIAGLIVDESIIDTKNHVEPNQGMKNSRNNMVILSAIALITGIPFKLLLDSTSIKPNYSALYHS